MWMCLYQCSYQSFPFYVNRWRSDTYTHKDFPAFFFLASMRRGALSWSILLCFTSECVCSAHSSLISNEKEASEGEDGLKTRVEKKRGQGKHQGEYIDSYLCSFCFFMHSSTETKTAITLKSCLPIQGPLFIHPCYEWLNRKSDFFKKVKKSDHTPRPLLLNINSMVPWI